MKPSPLIRSIVTLSVALGLVSGCDVQSYDDAVAGIPASPPPPPPPPPSPPPPPPPPAGFNPVFSEIQVNVFTPDCATGGCHSGGNPPAGLNLEEANSYAELVGIASSQDGAFQRVAPNDPDNSYLIRKLEGTASTSTQMPPGAPLPQSEIDVIRQWVTDGALDDRVVASNPIRVASLSPMPQAMLDAPPANIVAGFDREPDATTVNANTFVLIASGGDGTFTDGNESRIAATSISVPAQNPRSAIFDLTGTILGDDTYRVSLLGSGASFIMDFDANALDGEFAGVLRSGNGTEGGDFTTQFTIGVPVSRRGAD